MDIAKKFRDKSMEFMNKQSVEKKAKYFFLFMMILIIVYWVGKRPKNLSVNNDRRLRYLYQDFPPISTINTSNERHSYKFRDYYVKTAYNCCASGTYKHNYVSLQGLDTCIQQGARCLDFQVYSIDNRPVIAVSDDRDYNVKGSYNSIPFEKVMERIEQRAFSGSTCPCPGDPLVLHFRILTKNTSIMNTMAESISLNLKKRVLGKEYSFETNGNNIGSVDLEKLKGKVVIVVDKSFANPMETKLDEYVNLTSNSAFMRKLQYKDVKESPDIQELTEYNKKYMTICIPNISARPENPSPAFAHNCGCQFVAMCFQKMDDKMRYYTNFFNEEGSAFVLKPKELRYIPVTIKVPKSPPKEHSYAKRKLETDYYSFEY